MQRYFAKDISNNNVILEDSDYHHIKNVMRMKNGDNIEIVCNSILYIASIVDINNRIINVIDEKVDNNELDIEVIVAISLVKEQKWI